MAFLPVPVSRTGLAKQHNKDGFELYREFNLTHYNVRL